MNIYYSPEKFGLKILHEYDPGFAYEFDTSVLFGDDAGNLFLLHDAGCSCPTPFESFGLEDCERVVSFAQLETWLENHAVPVIERHPFIDAAKEALLVSH